MGVDKTKKCFILGVAGGSCSGKTTLRRRLEQLFPNQCSVVMQDDYYIDQSHKFDYDGGSVNFDHPSALDFPLLAAHLKELSQGRSIQSPLYDFVEHKRQESTKELLPRPLIIVDGTLILHNEPVRKLLDLSIFVHADEELRFNRRLKRDTEERGRSPEGVKQQFHTQVKPMHDQYVAPSGQSADIELHSDETFERRVAELRDLVQSRVFS